MHLRCHWQFFPLTRWQICGNARRAANCCQEPTSCINGIRSKLDCDGGGAGEGARDGGAVIVDAGGADILDGGAVIDPNKVLTNIISKEVHPVECNGDCLSIG